MPQAAHAIWSLMRRHDTRLLARAIGRSESLLYKWSEGSKPVPAWAGPALYLATHDLDFLSEWIGADELGVILSPRAPASPSREDTRDQALDLGGVCGQLQAAVRAAEQDGVIDAKELGEIQGQVKRALRLLETLDHTVERRHREDRIVAAAVRKAIS